METDCVQKDAASLLTQLSCCSLKGSIVFNMIHTENGPVAKSFSIPFRTLLPDRLDTYNFLLSTSTVLFIMLAFAALMCYF